MAHRLCFHKGKCFNLHGHNYEVKISVEGTLDKDGLILDFSDLKNIFNTYIHNEIDHSLMYWDKDPLAPSYKDMSRIMFLEVGKELKLVNVPFETTAENIAKWIHDIMNREVQLLTKGRCIVNRVKVYETPTSEAVSYESYNGE